MGEEASKPKKKLKIWQIALIIVGSFALIGQFTGGSDTSGPSENTAVSKSADETDKVDFVTKRACRIWRQVIDEGSKGVQTTEELRAGMKEVYEVAKVSYDADIVKAATRQLAAITNGDVDAFKVAATDFGVACQSKGQ
jgi:hypothetical protein